MMITVFFLFNQPIKNTYTVSSDYTIQLSETRKQNSLQITERQCFGLRFSRNYRQHFTERESCRETMWSIFWDSGRFMQEKRGWGIMVAVCMTLRWRASSRYARPADDVVLYCGKIF